VAILILVLPGRKHRYRDALHGHRMLCRLPPHSLKSYTTTAAEAGCSKDHRSCPAVTSLCGTKNVIQTPHHINPTPERAVQGSAYLKRSVPGDDTSVHINNGVGLANLT